ECARGGLEGVSALVRERRRNRARHRPELRPHAARDGRASVSESIALAASPARLLSRATERSEGWCAERSELASFRRISGVIRTKSAAGVRIALEIRLTLTAGYEASPAVMSCASSKAVSWTCPICARCL